MNCQQFRSRLISASRDPAPPDVSLHLEVCTDCRRFAARLARVREALQEHQAGIRPGAGFTASVLELLPSRRPDPLANLGWAAARLMPVTLMLAVLVSWMALQPPTGFPALWRPGAGDDLITAFVVSGLDDPALEEPP